MKLKLSVTRDFGSQCEEKQKKEILERQKHRCKACAISIKKYPKFENTKNGYIGLCSVCHTSQHLEMLPQKSAGKIIMLPEMSQIDLIALSRMIMLIKRLSSEEHSEDIDSAGLIHMLLNEAGQHAESFYASGASDVELVAQMLSNQTNEAYENREKGLYNMKWLPDYDYFKKEMDYWFKVLIENEKSTYHPTKWENLHNMYLKNNKE